MAPAQRCDKAGLMSQLDQKLRDLLVREAHLKLSREQLRPVWAEKEAELRAVQASKPTFLPIMGRRAKEEYFARLAAAQETVTILRTGLDLIERCEPHIKKMIEEEIENVLRGQCEEYVEAMAARRQKEDWVRCLDRFAAKIFDFTRSLGNVRNIACSGYARDTKVYSQGAVQGFVLAIEAAQKVEAEIKFANKISAEQQRLLKENGFDTRPLPRLQETAYAVWVSKISSLPLAEAQVQFDLLIEQTKKLHDTGIPELKAQADNVDVMQANEIHNFLLAAWEQFRAEITPEIFSGDTERNVAETERMLVTTARKSVLGRLETTPKA
jgi:hypothetical protein